MGLQNLATSGKYRLQRHGILEIGTRGTVMFLNFRTPENFPAIYLKFKQRSQILGYFIIKDANGIANSVDPDQTAPLGAA